MAKYRRNLENIAPEYKVELYEKLDEKGIKYYTLGLYKFGRIICVDCPYTNERIWIKSCKNCKNFLGSTGKMKNHWLCKKELCKKE